MILWCPKQEMKLRKFFNVKLLHNLFNNLITTHRLTYFTDKCQRKCDVQRMSYKLIVIHMFIDLGLTVFKRYNCCLLWVMPPSFTFSNLRNNSEYIYCSKRKRSLVKIRYLISRTSQRHISRVPDTTKLNKVRFSVFLIFTKKNVVLLNMSLAKISWNA